MSRFLTSRIVFFAAFIAGIYSSSLPSPLAAQIRTQTGETSASSSPLRLTLEQAVTMGLQASRALHSSEMKVKAAEAKAGESGAALLPSLGVSATYARLSDIPLDKQFRFNPSGLLDINRVNPQLLADPGVQRSLAALGQAFGAGETANPEQPSTAFPVLLDNYSLQANITYPAFTGFRLEAAKAAADYSAEAAVKDFARERLETEFAVKNAYWSLYKALQLQTLTKETIEQVETRLKEIQTMMKNGMLTSNDMLRVQLQLSNAKLTKIDADNAVRLSRINLNNALGLPLETIVEPVSTLEYKPNNIPDYERAIARALESRPDVSATQLRILAAEEGVRAARGGYLPSLGVSGNFLYANPNQRFIGRPAEWNWSWQIGAQISWTLWNWNTTGYQVAQAEAQAAQANDGLSMLKDGIKLEVTQNYLTLLQAREKVSVAEEAVAQANENYRVTGEKYKKGLALTSELTEAQTLQLQAKTQYASAVVDYEIAQARLAKSIGGTQIAER